MHKTTLEFTKDEELSLNGDCIVGVKADFSLAQLKNFIKSLKGDNKVEITIETINEVRSGKIIEKINAEINPNFNSDKELVLRKTGFISERTFAIKADKAAFELNKGLIRYLSVKGGNILVSIKNKP